MAQTVGQHPIATFTSPTNGDLLDATVVKGNDNTTRDAYVAHDADPGIHLQSSLLAARPAAGEVGRKWLTTDTGSVKLWFDTGAAWEEISYVSTGNLPSNLIPSVTNTYDIGSSSLKWKDVYAQGNVSVGGGVSAGGAVSAGSATVTNDLTVDTNTFKVDSTNNRVGIGTATPTVALDVIGAASVRSVEFDGTTSGTVTMQPAAAAGTWSLTLPTTPGTSGQFLSTDGSGVTTWASQSGGFTDVSITPTVAAPYQVTTADVSKRLVMNSSVTGGINFTPANTNSIAVGSTMKIASFGAATTINTLDGTLGQLPFDNYGFQGGSVLAFATLTDGSVLVGGSYSTVINSTRYALTRIASGVVDTTFTPVTNPDTVWALAVQSDGKIIVGGVFTTISGTTRGSLARINANGTIDSTFADPQVTSGGLFGTVNAVAIQSDGKILIGGTFDSVAGTTRNNIARLNADGTLDTTYNPNADAGVQVIRLQSDGKALVGGSFLTIGGASRTRLARLLTTGANDSTFANPNANNIVYALALQSDGKVLVGGQFTSVAATTRNYIARVNADGTLDATYNPNANSFVRGIALQSDGKAVVGGQFTTMSATSRNYVARVNTDGTLDTTYNPNANNNVFAVAMQSSGNALIGGQFSLVSGVLMMQAASVPSTGTLAPVFGTNTNGQVTAWAQQSDGKILMGGVFTTVAGVTRQRLARLNSNGTLDTAFADPQLDNAVYDIAIQSDGKIIIVGEFTFVGGTARNYIARFNADGTLDTAYNPSSSSPCYTVALQSDGKAIVGGNFSTIGGGSRTRIARLNTNGTLDTTFTSATTFNTFGVTTVLVASDGSIYAANQNQGPVRLTTTGTSDPSWTNQNCGAYAMALQSNGQLVIGGAFTTIGGTTRNYLARLSSTGSLDLTFNPAPNSVVYSVAVLGDQRIIAQGSFTTVNGLTRSGLVLLAPSGVDGGVAYTGGTSYYYHSLLVQTDKNVLFGGTFSVINGVYRGNAGQLNFSADAINAPYGGQTALARYSVITLEKLAAGSWAITESNCS